MNLTKDMKPVKVNDRPKAVRRFFKELYKLHKKWDRENSRGNRSALTREILIQHDYKVSKKEVKRFLEETVLIDIRATDLLHLGIQFMKILSDNSVLNELLIAEAIGDYNWTTGFCASRNGWTTHETLELDRVKWDKWMEEVVPLFLLLSKKQKMPDEDYIRCARSVIGVLMVKVDDLLR